jgi:hypothetical protein
VAEIPSAREATVAKVEDHDGPEPQPEADLEYDLAHEWTTSPDHADAARVQSRVYVATETVDQGGDYGYDMAHDVPSRLRLAQEHLDPDR